MMADPLKTMSDELGVCREEALFYLEGFRWNLNAAMEACLSKTLPSPSLKVQSSPVNEKSASEDQSKNQKIVNFIEWCVGSTVDDAKRYLNMHFWNLEVAVNSFIEQQRPTLSERKLNSKNPRPISQPFSNDDRTAIQQSNLQSSEEIGPKETSNIFEKGEMASSMSSSHQEPNPSQLKEQIIKIFRQRATGAFPKAALDCLNYCNWNVEDAISYFLGGYRTASPGMATAQVVKNFTGKALGQGSRTEAVPPMASSQVTESGNLTQTSEENLSPPTSQTQLCNELIGSSQLPSQMQQFQLQKEFCNLATEASPKVAHDCLTYCKWNLQDALNYFLKGEYIEASPEKVSSQVDNVLVPPFKEAAEAPPNLQAQLSNEEIITSFLEVAVELSVEEAIEYLEFYDWNINQAADNYVAGNSVEQLSTAKTNSLTQNRRRTMGLPSKLQFEDSYVSQSQEGGTQRSHEEAGEGNVTAAIPGMASSQVDGKAVEEGSSTEKIPEPDTIAITLILADEFGTSLDLTFRSNETVKDIRNAIQERTPDKDRDYYLQSVSGEEYRDSNVTVHKISSRGCTTLIQVFLDQQQL